MDLLECLRHVDPASCSYDEWCQVGMALKHEGYQVPAWDSWSARDSARYHAGDCEKKWESFHEETDTPVTGGTIVELAKRRGWVPDTGDAVLDWNDTLVCDAGKQEGVIIDRNWVEGQEVHPPENKDWNPREELARYLEALFQPDECVGYVTECFEDSDGHLKPGGKGVYARTAGEIVEDLKRYKDMGKAIGDYDQACGAWIRFNPLDGKGVRNANVTNFRYALIESDSMPIDRQNALIRALELPVAAMVHSGGKSIHAIVHIDAKDYNEYRQRVDCMYKACEKNGLLLDKQNRNPSRLSRMPGVMRAGKKQFLIATNFGKESYEAWLEWYEEQNDDLPEFENLEAVWDRMPPLAPPLIEGVLRQGHKMLISGPSKAGKSFAQIEMAIAIAEGARWMGWKCSAGKVVYVNFELDRPSCLHRFADVYAAMGLNGSGRSNIEIWNLRGQSMQLDKLAPKLIRRAQRVKPIAIILDPIYKTLTGDENSAEQMAIFCNQFDRVCTEVGCSVIYCHHHSKGAQGGKKAMDRASGSGVFARDPDALLDLIELPLRDSHYDYLKVRAACRAIIAFLDKHAQGWRDDAGLDDFLSKPALMECARKEGRLSASQLAELDAAVAEAERHASHITAWRISCTLREYERPDDRDVYFSWPVHVADDSGALKDIRPEIEVGGRIIQPRDKSDGSKKETKEKEERQSIIDAYTLIASEKEPDDDGMVRVTVQDFVEHSEECFGKEIQRASMYKKLRKFGDFTIEDSIVSPAENKEE